MLLDKEGAFVPYSRRIRRFFEKWPGCMAGALLSAIKDIYILHTKNAKCGCRLPFTSVLSECARSHLQLTPMVVKQHQKVLRLGYDVNHAWVDTSFFFNLKPLAEFKCEFKFHHINMSG